MIIGMVPMALALVGPASRSAARRALIGGLAFVDIATRILVPISTLLRAVSCRP